MTSAIEPPLRGKDPQTPLGGCGRPPQLLASSAWAPVLRSHFVVSERGTCSPTPRSPGFRGANPPRTEERRHRGRQAELRWEPAGSTFIIVPPAPGTGWSAGSEGGLKRAVPSASPAREALAPQVFPGRLPRARPEPSASDAREGQLDQLRPSARGEENSRPALAARGARGRKGTCARPRPVPRARDGAPGPAPGPRLPLPPPRDSAALRSAGSMGKAAALCRGSGCGGRSRGLSSLFTVVPCLSCHTAAPTMSVSTPGPGPEPKPQPKPPPQPVPKPERQPGSEEVPEPLSEPVPRLEPVSEKTSEPRPESRQGAELLLGLGRGSGPRPELGSSIGAGTCPKASSEQLPALGSVVGSAPWTKPELGSLAVSKPPPLLRPGQAKASLGVPMSGTGTTSTAPKVLLPLDSFKGWLLKWTNYLKGYQRRWFVLSNGLLSYYRYAGATLGHLRLEGGDAALMVTEVV